METDDLPNDFDVIVLGTGLTETIVAASFSRIGLKVLHLDRNNYYGGSYANFNLQGIEEWKQKNEEVEKSQDVDHAVTEDLKQLAGEGNAILSLPCETAHAQNIKIKFHVRENLAAEKGNAEISLVPTSSISVVPANESSSQASSQSFDNSCPAGCPESIPEATSTDPVNIDRLAERLEKEHMQTDSGAEGDGCEQEGETQRESTAKDEELSKKSSLEGPSKGTPQHWTVESLQQDWRKYCFDLSPRVLYCSGDLVELLIQSDVARYCEFRTVSRVLTSLNDTLQQVPCSRADVFSSKIVSLIEKRLMMKFLQFASDFRNHPDEYSGYKDKPFAEFLKSKKLSANIQHFVQHAIAMVNDLASTEEGLIRTQRFLHSLGRYGNTAFLFSLYGSGELPQAFSRLSAVFGGTYCLLMSASHLIADGENKCCGIVSTQGKKISCKYLIAEASYLPKAYVQCSSVRKTSRAIYITNKSICESKDPELSLLNYVCKHRADKTVSVMELPHSACVCPKGLFIVHLTRESILDSPEEDFKEVKNDLFALEDESDKPRVLWSLYFNYDDLSEVSLTSQAVGNMFVTSGGGDACIDMEKSVEEARQIFRQVCPTEEFLAKPPNPEDIIYVDDGEATVAKGPGEFASSDEKKEESAENESDASDEKKQEAQDNQPDASDEKKQEAQDNQPDASDKKQEAQEN